MPKHPLPISGLALVAAFTGMVSVPAFVSAAPSPSPAPVAPDAMAPSFFAGSAPTTGACAIGGPTGALVDGVLQTRGAAWGCLTWTTDDPRFSGVSRNVYDADQYLADASSATGRLGTITVGRERIENDAGAWEGTWTDLVVEDFDQVAGWFEGQGAYAGLAAYVVISDPLGSATVRGFISPAGRMEAPASIPPG